MKHTPGPWKLVAQTGGYYDVTGNSDFAGYSTSVCRVHRHTEGKVNLALILAAPELLDALRELHDFADTNPRAFDRSREAFRKALALLEKLE